MCSRPRFPGCCISGGDTADAMSIVTGVANLSGNPAGDAINPLGDNLLPWLLLAFGAAMVVGNLLALIRPPRAEPGERPAEPPPFARAVGLIVVGGVAAIWALASLLKS